MFFCFGLEFVACNLITGLCLAGCTTCHLYPTGGTLTTTTSTCMVSPLASQDWTSLRCGLCLTPPILVLYAHTASVRALTISLLQGEWTKGYGSVLDSGTTFTYLTRDAFNAFKAGLDEHHLTSGLKATDGPDPHVSRIPSASSCLAGIGSGPAADCLYCRCVPVPRHLLGGSFRESVWAAAPLSYIDTAHGQQFWFGAWAHELLVCAYSQARSLLPWCVWQWQFWQSIGRDHIPKRAFAGDCMSHRPVCHDQLAVFALFYCGGTHGSFALLSRAIARVDNLTLQHCCRQYDRREGIGRVGMAHAPCRVIGQGVWPVLCLVLFRIPFPGRPPHSGLGETDLLSSHV